MAVTGRDKTDILGVWFIKPVSLHWRKLIPLFPGGCVYLGVGTLWEELGEGK